jgi:hypothetical protein
MEDASPSPIHFPAATAHETKTIAAAYDLARESVEKSTAMCAYSLSLIERTQAVIERSMELLSIK